MNRVAIVNVCSGTESTSDYGKLLVQEIAGDSQNQWHISNKYYEATLHFDELESKEKITSDYQAVVILHDFYEVQSLDRVVSYWSGQTEAQTDIQILVGVDGGSSENVPDSEALRKKALEWCIGSGFELVMWRPGLSEKKGVPDESPGLLEEEDEDDSFEGLRRIKDALQAHMWPDMTMKSSKPRASTNTGLEDKLPRECSTDDQRSGDSDESKETKIPAKTKRPTQDEKYSLLPDDLVSSGMLDEMCREEGEDGGIESFERLFNQLPKMKETAANLPHGQRLDYAEKVVMAFWNALGDGIDDPDEDPSLEEDPSQKEDPSLKEKDDKDAVVSGGPEESSP